MLEELYNDFYDEILDPNTGERTVFYIYRDICKMGVSFLNAYAHICSNLLNLNSENSTNMNEICKIIAKTITYIDDLSPYLFNMTNKFTTDEFLECDFFLFINLNIITRFSPINFVLNLEGKFNLLSYIRKSLKKCCDNFSQLVNTL